MTRKFREQKKSGKLLIALAFIGLSATTMEAQVRLGNRGHSDEFRNELRENMSTMPEMLTVRVGFVQEHKLEVTQEIVDMVVSYVYLGLSDVSDGMLHRFGVRDRSQLSNLQLGKPMANYMIGREGFHFMNIWEFVVFSDNEPLLTARIRLTDDGEYVFTGAGSAGLARTIYDYEHKDLIIGLLKVSGFNAVDYFYIRKDDRDVFVRVYDWETQSLDLISEFSLSDIINKVIEGEDL